LPGNIVTPCTK